MHHFTQLQYLPFCVCKPDLDTALSAIISDCGTDIRNMMQSYGSAKVWLTVQVQYEPANPRDQKNKSFEFYLTCAATRFFRCKPTEVRDGAPYAEPLLELFERIKKLSHFYARTIGTCTSGLSSARTPRSAVHPIGGSVSLRASSLPQSKKGHQ